MHFSELIISNMFNIKFITEMPFNLACLIGANLVRLHYIRPFNVASYTWFKKSIPTSYIIFHVAEQLKMILR